MNRLRILTLLAVIASLAVACGVPRSSKFTSIDRANIPFGLSETTSTTTPPPSTTIAIESTTTVLEQATTIATEPVLLYYVAGSQLVNVSTMMLPRRACV